MAQEKSRLVQGYEVVIGFETHTQLTTASKIFSRIRRHDTNC
jgi:aspartyl-tRNA(Asn)/glutamyl-tRNA(Gln) amidotransferase subunit B